LVCPIPVEVELGRFRSLKAVVISALYIVLVYIIFSDDTAHYAGKQGDCSFANLPEWYLQGRYFFVRKLLDWFFCTGLVY
jgi:hypothetical protein